MNKGIGTAFGFLLVLAVVVLGFYVAFSSYRSTRAAILARPTATTRPATATARPTTAATSTYTPIPTPIPGITLTQTATAMPSPSATPKGFKPTRTPKPKKTATPLPPTATVPAVGSFEFLAAGPPAPVQQSGCCYLLGAVRDAAGNGLAGVRVQARNEWGRQDLVETKDGIDLGLYNFPIGPEKVTWYLQIVGADGNALSTQQVVTFDPGIAPAVRVDWKKQ